MKNLIKILYGLIWLLVVGIIAYFCVHWDGCGKKKKVNKAITKTVNQVSEIQHQLLDDTTVHYTKKQEIHSESSVITGTKKELDIYKKKSFDSMANIIGIQSSQISSLKSELVTAKGDLNGVLEWLGDSTYEIQFDSDCLLNAFGLFDLKTNRGKLHYDVPHLQLHDIIYMRANHQLFRQSFLRNIAPFKWIKWGGTRLTTDTWTDCPNVQIDSIQDIQVINQN